MNDKLSKEEQKSVLDERIFSSETFAKTTAQFNLNTRIYIFTPNKLLAVDEDNTELEYFIKLHEVFRLSKEFKTDFWIDDLFEEHADLHAVSQNGYLYISCDTYRDLECEYSSKMTLEFANDICHAFEEYCGKELICEIEPPNNCHSDETWIIIKVAECEKGSDVLD